MIHANNAGTSWPKPPEVAQAVAGALARAPGECSSLYGAAHATTCRYFGIQDANRFLFTSGCTAALALAIGDLPWREGDIIITSALEHHALARPVDKLVRERGVVHEVAPYRPGEPIDLDHVERVLRRGKVRLVATTGASNVTGELLPVARLASLAHAHDALYLLDAAQTAGVVPIDVEQLGADMLVFAGHKGPLAPHGIGGFYAAPHVVFESPWATCDLTPGADRAACSTFPDFCDVGSTNLGGAAGLDAGLRWLEENGSDRPRELARQLATGIAEREGCSLIGGGPVVERTATLGVVIDELALERTEPFFARRGVEIRAARHCAPMALEAVDRPHGTLRISLGQFNTQGDVDRLLAVIDEARDN